MRDKLAFVLYMLLGCGSFLAVGCGAPENQCTTLSVDVSGYVARTLQPTLNSEQPADQAVTIAMSQQTLTDMATVLASSKTLSPAQAEADAMDLLQVILEIIKSGVLSNLPSVFGDTPATMTVRADLKADLIAYGKAQSPENRAMLKADWARWQALHPTKAVAK